MSTGNLLNSTGDLLNSLSEPAQDPVVQIGNQTIMDLHAAFETLGHENGLNGTMHGLTELGETVGFGKVGGDNLITDTAQAPGDILNGASPVTEAADIVTDGGQTLRAAGVMVEGIGSDLSDQDLVNGLPTLGDGGDCGPAVSVDPVVSIDADVAGDSPIMAARFFAAPNTLSVGVGESGDSPIVTADVLADPSDGTPIDVSIGGGQDIADVSVLPNGLGSSDCAPASDDGHLITANAGDPDGASILNAGVLTDPDAQSPVGLAVGDGPNIVTANALSSTDLLSYPDMGGAGTDALNGFVPSVLALAQAADDPASAPCGCGDPLIEASTDGSALLQVNDNATSTLGVNDHVIV